MRLGKEVIGLEPLTLTVEEAGKALRLGRSAAYEAVRTGQIPSIRIGKRVLVPRIALEQMVSDTRQVETQ
jgi:excisionase family DNA binding protein